MMHRRLLGLSAALAATVAALPVTSASAQVPQIPYESVPNFLKMPADMHLGEAAGVAVNSKGHVFVYSRSGSSLGPAYGNAASQLLEFDPGGKFVREIGKNLYAWSFAHTVRIDKDDNIWATDKGSDMIIKFNNKDGKVMMVFGRKSESSDEDAHPLHRPNPPLPAACIAIWARRDGRRTAAVLGCLGLSAFALSHLLANLIGAWPAVLVAAALTAATCWWTSDARAGRTAPAAA